MDTQPTASPTNESAISTLKGTGRLRAAVVKVIHQISSVSGAFHGAGAEQGVNPRHPSAVAAYGHLREPCSIRVVDYSSVRFMSREFSNQQFKDFLKENGTAKESWVKVRWISIEGISWDVISTLTETYGLHPLSVEDVLRRRGHTRSKADYFSKHLFLCIPSISLGSHDDIKHPSAHSSATAPIAGPQQSPCPACAGSSHQKNIDTQYSDKSGSESSWGKKLDRDLEAGRAHSPIPLTSPPTEQAVQLKAEGPVNVLLKDLFLFLFRDGTLVSIHQNSSAGFAQPILKRLRTRSTDLRTTADPSLLLESILDFVVDKAVEVADEYLKKISDLKRDISLKPMHTHTDGLSEHKRTLESLQFAVYELYQHDLDHCTALAASSAGADADAVSRKVVGYMSHKSKIYLAAVRNSIQDNIFKMEKAASEKYLNFNFNKESSKMNKDMHRLTWITIIFLPLTLLTGYFGMNFESMWSIQTHSDVLFWEIALPVMAVVFLIFK